MEGLEADRVVAVLDSADLDVDEIAGFEHAVRRGAVNERGARAGRELGRDRRVVRPGAAHRVLDLRRKLPLADARTRVFERGPKPGFRERTGAAEERELALRLDQPRVGQERRAVDAGRRRQPSGERLAEGVRDGARTGVEADDACAGRVCRDRRAKGTDRIVDAEAVHIDLVDDRRRARERCVSVPDHERHRPVVLCGTISACGSTPLMNDSSPHSQY